MKKDRALKHFAYAFVFAGLLYVVLFWAIEYRRSAKGPWQVEFRQSSTGVAEVQIDQPGLGIRAVRIRFPDETSIPIKHSMIVFDRARRFPHEVPYGRCVFADLTFLPGTVAMDLFGQRVELLPSKLILGESIHPWQSGTTLDVRTRP